MLLGMGAARAAPPRLAVFAYDIASPRRSRAARAALQGVQTAAQYSVFEAMLTPPEFRGLLAEVTAACNLAEDKLAVWWPRDGARLEWRAGRILPRGASGADALEAMVGGAFNFIVCYDVSDESALRRISQAVASQAAQVQRSVYWLRTPREVLVAQLAAWAGWLSEGDRLWV